MFHPKDTRGSAEIILQPHITCWQVYNTNFWYLWVSKSHTNEIKLPLSLQALLQCIALGIYRLAHQRTKSTQMCAYIGNQLQCLGGDYKLFKILERESSASKRDLKQFETRAKYNYLGFEVWRGGGLGNICLRGFSGYPAGSKCH